jgi:hypothetical protein
VNYFADVSGLHRALRAVYENAPPEARRPALAEYLEQNGFTAAQASLFAHTVLVRNAEGSADWTRTNVSHLCGTWIRSEQQGVVSGWLKTTLVTWKFAWDLTYERKVEKHEDYSTGPSPFFQSSYSHPSIDLECGIWAPPDALEQQIEVFVMSMNGYARTLQLQWVDNENYDYRACVIDGQRFIHPP